MNEYKDQYKLTGNFVNDGFKLSTAISCIGREMRGLSQAFMVTGNEKLSNQFFDLEQELEVISDCIKELAGKSLMSSSKVSFGNMKSAGKIKKISSQLPAKRI